MRTRVLLGTLFVVAATLGLAGLATATSRKAHRPARHARCVRARRCRQRTAHRQSPPRRSSHKRVTHHRKPARRSSASHPSSAAHASSPTTSPASAAPATPVTTPSGAPVTAPASTSSTTPVPPSPPARLQVSAREFSLTLSRQQLTAGPAVIEFDDAGEDPHDLHIRPAAGGADVGAFSLSLPGSHADHSITLAPGTYTLYCSLPQHELLGMHATLVVG